MSVFIEITRMSLDDVPDEMKRPVGELISELQFALLYELGIVQHGEGIEDSNDNGTWPVIDIEVQTEVDPDGSSRRLIVAPDKETLLYHTQKYPATEGGDDESPDWESMCRSLWHSADQGDGHDFDHNMNYIEKYINKGDN